MSIKLKKNDKLEKRLEYFGFADPYADEMKKRAEEAQAEADKFLKKEEAVKKEDN